MIRGGNEPFIRFIKVSEYQVDMLDKNCLVFTCSVQKDGNHNQTSENREKQGVS